MNRQCPQTLASKWGLAAIALLALCAVGRSVAARVQAQTRALPLDIVLAVDQSGSMAQSDPDNRRIEAARQLVQTSAAFQDAYEIRIGAVEFGSAEWRGGSTLRSTLGLTAPSRVTVTDSFKPDTLAGTDFKGALCLAWATVTAGQLPADAQCPPVPQPKAPQTQPRQAGQRDRAIVLITDGFPAPGADARDLRFDPADSLAGCPGMSEGNAYFCSLQQTWATLTKAQPVRLFILGIDQDNEWFPTAEPYWRAITGCQSDLDCHRAVRRSANPEALISDVIEAAVGAVVDLCRQSGSTNECQLPGFLSEAQFVVEGLAPGDSVRIVGPDGVERSQGAGAERIAEGDRQRWRVKAPQRGAWRVESSNASAQLTVSRVAVPVHFELQAIPTKPVAGDTISILAVPDPGSPIDLGSVPGEPLDLEVRSADGQATTTSVSLRQSSSGLIIGDVLKTAARGDYVLTLSMPLGDKHVPIGQAKVAVAERPAATPTAIPTSAPIATASVAAPQTAATVAPLFATPTPSPCQAAFSSGISPRGVKVSGYSGGLSGPWPIRIFKRASVTGTVAGCTPKSVPSQLILRVQAELTDRAHGSDAQVWRSSDTGTFRVGGQLSQRTIDTSRVHRTLQLDDGQSLFTLQDDHVQLVTPWWVTLWQQTGLGYLIYPLVLLALLLGVGIWSASRRSSSGVPLRDAAVWNEERKLREPLVQAGFFVWRPVNHSTIHSRGTLSLKYLLFGPMVLRYPTPAPGGRAPKSVIVRVQTWWKRQQTSWLGSEAAARQISLMKRERKDPVSGTRGTAARR
jgi:hypothetical protein